MPFCKRVLKQTEEIPRYGTNINNCFLGTVCCNIFCKSCFFKNILMHLLTKLVGKDFFNISFDILLPHETSKKFKTIENIRKSNVNIKPFLCSSTIKLLKLE